MHLRFPKKMFVAAACNRHTEAAACCPETDLVAFASHHAIALWHPGLSNGVMTLLMGHEMPVNCVQWVKTRSNGVVLISASVDGTARVWRHSNASQEVHIHDS